MGIFLREASAELQSLGNYNDPHGLYARLPFELRLK
jgi:protease-4